jgi:predicted subunit of tRNA(5-methylaminomethyl-2-thiouridylate) methyltransferase
MNSPLAFAAAADTDWRSRAQLKLHRAAAEADAQDVVATLSDAQRSDRFVRMIAKRALASCESRGAATAELREVLSAA